MVIYTMIYLLLIVLYSVLSKHTQIESWRFRIPNKTSWLAANVPSTVHLDLLDNKLIQDPYFGANIMDLYWIETSDVQYSTNFSIDADSLQSINQYIVFQGLDTHCDVILNNKTILHADNMFRTWRVPVQLQQNNILSVYFYSSVNYDLNEEKKIFQKHGFKLPYNYSFTRKAAYQYGWDWGPRLVTAGIWKKVYIEAYNYTRLDNILVRHNPVDQNTTNITLYVEMQFHDLNYDSQYSFELSTLENISEIRNNSFPKPTYINFTYVTALQLNNIKLWWTHDIGTPQMYTLNLRLFENDVEVLNKTQRFGIRTVTVSQKTDSTGKQFTIVLNGKEIFMRGGNYIPPDMFMPRALKNPSVYDRIIKDSLFAKYNMLRIWGGGQFEYDIFYEKCDQAGILIWHDLMFACAMYPGSEDIFQNIKNQMIDNLKRLRNHPSIGLWNGNNEVWIGWQQWDWKANKSQSQIKLIQHWYDKIFKQILPETIERYDNQRFYWQTSPSSSSNSLSTINSGDIHFWQVWGGAASIELYSSYIGRFNSEFGMQSMTEFNSILKFTNASDRTLDSYVMRLHQRHIYGNEYLPMYVYSYASVVTDSTNLSSFSYFSQVMQSYALRTAIDALRTSSVCMGSLYWQLNDLWPVSSWSTVDYYGMYKAAHYTARSCHQLVYPTMLLKNSSYNIYIVNDDIKTVSGILKYTILDFQGNILKPMSSSSYFMAAGRRSLVESIPKNIMSNYVKDYYKAFVKLQFQSTKLFTNYYYFGRPIQSTGRAPKLSLSLNDNRLEISTDVMARWVYIYRKDGVSMLLDKNYFDIAPGCSEFVDIASGVLLQNIGVLQYYSSRELKMKQGFLQSQ